MHATQYIYKGEFAFFKVDNLRIVIHSRDGVIVYF